MYPLFIAVSEQVTIFNVFSFTMFLWDNHYADVIDGELETQIKIWKIYLPKSIGNFPWKVGQAQISTSASFKLPFEKHF